MKQFATDLGTPGRDDEYGYGLINPRAALRGMGLAMRRDARIGVAISRWHGVCLVWRRDRGRRGRRRTASRPAAPAPPPLTQGRGVAGLRRGWDAPVCRGRHVRGRAGLLERADLRRRCRGAVEPPPVDQLRRLAVPGHRRARVRVRTARCSRLASKPKSTSCRWRSTWPTGSSGRAQSLTPLHGRWHNWHRYSGDVGLRRRRRGRVGDLHRRARARRRGVARCRDTSRVAGVGRWFTVRDALGDEPTSAAHVFDEHEPRRVRPPCPHRGRPVAAAPGRAHSPAACWRPFAGFPPGWWPPTATSRFSRARPARPGPSARSCGSAATPSPPATG